VLQLSMRPCLVRAPISRPPQRFERASTNQALELSVVRIVADRAGNSWRRRRAQRPDGCQFGFAFLHLELAQAATADTHHGHCCPQRGKQESSDLAIRNDWHLETESLSARGSESDQKSEDENFPSGGNAEDKTEIVAERAERLIIVISPKLAGFKKCGK
jgi:hypothetical protein